MVLFSGMIVVVVAGVMVVVKGVVVTGVDFETIRCVPGAK